MEIQIKKKPGFLFSLLIFCLVLYSDLLSADHFLIYSLQHTGDHYPSNPVKLSSLLSSFIEIVPEIGIPSAPQGLMVPYDKYIYSGPNAAYAYKQLENRKYEVVVLMATGSEKGARSSIYEGNGITTPLGLLNLDNYTVHKILQDYPDLFELYKGEIIENYALESQIPFIYHMLGNIKTILIEINNSDLDHLTNVANALFSSLSGKKVLYIASSNLSRGLHYHQAQTFDQYFTSIMRNASAYNLYQNIQDGNCYATDWEAVVVMQMASSMMEKSRTSMLRYYNSGEVTGDLNKVTGYLSACVYQDNITTGKPLRAGSPSLFLSGKEASCLLGAVERKLKHIFGEQVLDEDNLCDYPAFKQYYGVFISLKTDYELRGCIGELFPTKPLGEIVDEIAWAAALHDPRVNPLNRTELEGLTIEICVINKPHRINDIQEVKDISGFDGVYLKNGNKSSLLMPEEGKMNDWEPETIFERACLKAGLNSNCYKDHCTEIYILNATVISKKVE
ncbi:AmmeMemoRadiSam system protein B [bacterium]|nr:AmmeMemoRadiSam system protein B [bacterium]